MLHFSFYLGWLFSFGKGKYLDLIALGALLDTSGVFSAPVSLTKSVRFCMAT